MPASIVSTPIEEPWVNQIHVALLKAQNELGIEYKWAESVPSAEYQRVLEGIAHDCPYPPPDKVRGNQYVPRCHAYFPDLIDAPRPPDLPPGRGGDIRRTS